MDKGLLNEGLDLLLVKVGGRRSKRKLRSQRVKKCLIVEFETSSKLDQRDNWFVLWKWRMNILTTTQGGGILSR